MIVYDHFEIKNPHELLKREDLEEFEQQYNTLLNSNVSDEEKGFSIGNFGAYLLKQGDDMTDRPSSKEVGKEVLKQGIKFLLKGAELGNSTSQKLVNELIEHGGYKEYGIPNESDIKKL